MAKNVNKKNREVNIGEDFALTAPKRKLPNSKNKKVQKKVKYSKLNKLSQVTTFNSNVGNIRLNSEDQENRDVKKKVKYSKLNKLSQVTTFDSNVGNIRLNSEDDQEVNICSRIYTEGSKYKDLFAEMSTNINNLRDGYECLTSFRAAELFAKGKNEPACVKGCSVGKVKFVMRKQFNKTPGNDIITPKRFACVVTLSADKMFREKLALDPVAMETAYQVLKNGFAKAHGFSVNEIPRSEEQKKLFYYYMVTTIGVHALMDINPVSCMAISKWRLEGNNGMKLSLHKGAPHIHEVYSRCLADVRNDQKYVVNTVNGSFLFKPDDIINNKAMLKKVMEEFKFLTVYAAAPCTGKTKKSMQK